MNLRTLWLAMALGASPLVAHAQISADVSFSWNAAPPADAIDSTDVFYDQLSPYGVWVNDPTVGQAFIPDQSDFVPYTNGHWENTDVGFVWVSDEPFSWATSHYGRWFYSNDYGRWMWMPDTTWGPNWVDWYDSGDNLGWAPLAPQVVINAGYQMPYAAYHYCPADHILDANVRSYYVPRDRVEVIQRQARPIAARASIGSHEVIRGPAPAQLAAHHVRAEVKHVEPKQMGRLSTAEVRTADQHARTSKPQIEQQNTRRLDQHAEIKKVQEQHATKAPARPTTMPTPARPEPQKAEPQRPEPQRTQTNRPEPQRTPARPEVNRPEPQKTEPTRPEPNRTAPTRPEPQRTAPVRPEVNRPEPQKAEPPRPEPQRVEPARPEPARPEPARPEMNRTAPTRPEPQRAEPARPEPQKAEPARPEPKASGHAQPEKNDKRKDQ